MMQYPPSSAARLDYRAVPTNDSDDSDGCDGEVDGGEATGLGLNVLPVRNHDHT